jgi:hypothetical protein
MQLIRTIFAASIFAIAAIGAVAPTIAEAQQQAQPRKRPVIINDPSVYRPPPLPRDRTYVGPGPSLAPPMQRIPEVAPLAQPPIR